MTDTFLTVEQAAKPKVYLAGYGKMKSVDELVALVARLGCEVVDIRYSPKSRKPGFDWAGLKRALGDNDYEWLPELGNVNYKGGAIEISDMGTGIAVLFENVGRPVLLLCACSDPKKCHRTVIGDELRRRGFDVEEVGGAA